MLSRIIAAAAACILLASCFLTPGKFESYLAINGDGSYRFAYKGQIQLVLPENGDLKPPRKPEFIPEDQYCRVRINNETGETEPLPDRYPPAIASAPPLPVADDNDNGLEAAAEAAAEAAESFDDARYQPQYRYENSECTEEQLAYKKNQQDLAYQAQLSAYQERIAALNAIFGGAIPGDDASMKKLAAKLENYAGWDSVEYQGSNIFLVEYNAEGSAKQGFTFPVMADASINLPFVQILPRKDGSYEVIAPGFGGKGNFGILSSLDRGAARRMGKMDLLRAKGIFTLTTDGELLSNNSEKGMRKEYGRKVVDWDVTEGLASPRALIRPAGE